MRHLAKELGVTWTVQDHVVGGRELNEMFPFAMPWWKVNSTLVIVIATIAIILGAAIVVAPKG
jgi:hypothetical protein